MQRHATVRTPYPGTRRPPATPPSVWSAFAVQAAWRNWTIIALLGIIGLLSMAVIRVSARPPEVVLLDAAGNATPVRRSLASEELLRFLGERNRPPEVTIVRFTRDFLHLAVGVNSSTIDAAWPAALALMSPELRERAAKEAVEKHLLDTYRQAQRKSELSFEEVVLEQRTPSVIWVRVRMQRRTGPLLDGGGSTMTDRIQVDLVERIIAPTVDSPDGLEVAEWRLTPLPITDSWSRPGETAKGVTHAP